MNPGNWHWYYADDKARDRLGEAPQSHLTNAEVVKKNAVRRVYRGEGLFIKTDSRSGRSFRGEFEAARMLGKTGIPVVRHLAWCLSPTGGMLITEAARNCVSAAEFVAAHDRLPEPFLDAFASFVGKLLHSKIFHPDFHLGNLLWNESDHSFLLVDVHGVRRRNWCDLFRMYRMRRIVLELRRQLSDAEMEKLAARCDIPDPEHFLKKGLRREALALRTQWPRRRRQIIAGYPKFCRKDGSRLVASGVAPETLAGENFVSVPRGGRIFCANFLLDLMLIPRRRVLAYDRLNSGLVREREPLPELPVPVSEQIERLEAFGVPTVPEQWSNGRLVDFDPVISSPWFGTAAQGR